MRSSWRLLLPTEIQGEITFSRLQFPSEIKVEIIPTEIQMDITTFY
jgi:hypothetical protein